MEVPATPTSSGQKLPKETNKSKYELYFNAIETPVKPVIPHREPSAMLFY